MSWFNILFISIIVEGLISYMKMIIVGKKLHYEVVISTLVGIVITLIYDIDLFRMIKIETRIPYIGAILTGILISRGSNYIYDFLKKIVGIKIDASSLEKQYLRPKEEINIDIVNHEV